MQLVIIVHVPQLSVWKEGLGLRCVFREGSASGRGRRERDEEAGRDGSGRGRAEVVLKLF